MRRVLAGVALVLLAGTSGCTRPDADRIRPHIGETVDSILVFGNNPAVLRPERFEQVTLVSLEEGDEGWMLHLRLEGMTPSPSSAPGPPEFPVRLGDVVEVIAGGKRVYAQGE